MLNRGFNIFHRCAGLLGSVAQCDQAFASHARSIGRVIHGAAERQEVIDRASEAGHNSAAHCCDACADTRDAHAETGQTFAAGLEPLH